MNGGESEAGAAPLPPASSFPGGRKTRIASGNRLRAVHPQRPHRGPQVPAGGPRSTMEASVGLRRRHLLPQQAALR